MRSGIAAETVLANRFVLVGVDPDTSCIARDLVFEIDDTARLATLLDIDPRSLDPVTVHPIEPEQLERLNSALDLVFDADSMEVWLRTWSPLDALPYKVHTNRELALMLAGVKPLAVFGVAPADTRDDEFSLERYFAPHVASGRFIRREHTYTDGRREVFYALPAEVGRIDAYVQLMETAQTTGWSEDFERLQGTLLGYEDWQNDVFIETVYRPAVAARRAG
jgi:hypothetical protein